MHGHTMRKKKNGAGKTAPVENPIIFRLKRESEQTLKIVEES